MKLPNGVRRTTGGTFDGDDPYVHFLAGGTTASFTNYRHLLFAVNELNTKAELEAFERVCDSGVRVMLDSGIFNLAMTHAKKHNVTHDVGLSMAPEEIDGFDELWDQYGRLVTKYADRLWGVVELDQGGIENKPRTRARIEEEFGVIPMPVYHPLLDGWDYYDALAKKYDRICFGNIVKAAPTRRLRLVHTAVERARAYPYLWTHFLGMTPFQGLLALPYRGSSDSSSWLTGIRWPPSWVAFSALGSIGHYPPPMWSHSGTNVDGNIDDHAAKALQIGINNARVSVMHVHDHKEEYG